MELQERIVIFPVIQIMDTVTAEVEDVSVNLPNGLEVGEVGCSVLTCYKAHTLLPCYRRLQYRSEREPKLDPFLLQRDQLQPIRDQRSSNPFLCNLASSILA